MPGRFSRAYVKLAGADAVQVWTGGGTATQATTWYVGTIRSEGVAYVNAAFTMKVWTGGSGANPRLDVKIQGSPWDDGTPTSAGLYTAIRCWTGGGTSPVGGRLAFLQVNSATADWTAGVLHYAQYFAPYLPKNTRAVVTVTGTAPEWKMCLHIDAEEL